MGLRFGYWLGHSRTLMCFFLSHFFVALAVCFGSLSCWNTHPRPIFNALAVHGSVHRPFDAVQLSCPLSRKTPPKHNVSTSMFDGGDGVLGVRGSIPPPPNTVSWCQIARIWYHRTTTISPSSPLNYSDVHWQTSDGPVHVLSWAGGPCGCCRISVLHGIVCVAYWFFDPWDEILHEAQDWGRLTVTLGVFNLRINRTNCCHLLTKPLGDDLVTHSSLM